MNSRPQASEDIFLSLAAGEVPPGDGLWIIEYQRLGERLGGWLGQLDWWCGGVIGRLKPQLCTGGQAELFLGLDWMLSEGLLLVPESGDPVQWTMQSVGRAAELGARNVQVGLNGLGLNESPVIRSHITSCFRPPAGMRVTFWLGGLFDPLRDGY